MLAMVASCCFGLAGMTVAAYALSRLRACRAEAGSLQREVARLNELLAAAQQEERLTAAIANGRGSSLVPQVDDALAAIAALGDPAAMQSRSSLSAAVTSLTDALAGVPDTLFEDNEREQKIVLWHQRGHSPGEIARRLGVPLGEVELRLSLRRG
jgi:DNA-directed RNA polymerase specialized sigma24 family protein